MSKVWLLFSVYLVFACSLVQAKNLNPEVSFYYQQLDNRNGLSNSSVNNIFVDKDQLLWIGTWDGLNRYDGTKFSVYNHNIGKVKNSIGSNVIQSINEDNHKNIWINTIGGISRYNKITGKVYRYFYPNTINQKVSENEYELSVNRNGDVFCYSADGTLSRYNIKGDKFERYHYFSGKEGITKMCFSENSLYYLNKKGELVIANTLQNKLTIVKKHSSSVGINNFFLVNNQLLYSLNNDTHFLMGVNNQNLQIGISNKKN